MIENQTVKDAIYTNNETLKIRQAIWDGLKINPDVHKKGVESKLDNIEKSIGNLKTMSEFIEYYKDFVDFILKINKEAKIGAMQVKSIILSNHWTIKYPFLLKDIRKITGELKLFGIEIVARLEE
jgi:hypothetical protein